MLTKDKSHRLAAVEEKGRYLNEEFVALVLNGPMSDAGWLPAAIDGIKFHCSVSDPRDSAVEK